MLSGALQSVFQAPLKTFYKFFLTKLIGKFVYNEFDLEQLDIQLTQGKIELSNLILNTEVRKKSKKQKAKSRKLKLKNKLTKTKSWMPFYVVLAKINRIRIDCPLLDLWDGACILHIDGFHMNVVPLIDKENIIEELSKFNYNSLARGLSKVLSIEDMDENQVEQLVTLHRGMTEKINPASAEGKKERSNSKIWKDILNR
ncbi:hypothetical protein RFI_38607 [Reticulomyxa filosa]|uniref:Autophagy-related protein 2 n=1 Tax=Reticulomyxa filosa TaxID=46433 RepID=X6LCS7_RETFI|nr:hypothetical protein RFI_38607 [Reticulomyxa filosa]|eukprot:ETN98881.1 hypothetical protein RFI_38607 [Reticulomyxa filosa]